MGTLGYSVEDTTALHSNLVIFQLIFNGCKPFSHKPLHSNLVIFQSLHYNNTYLQTLKDTFCRPLFLSSFCFIIFCKLFLLSLFRPLQYWLCLSPYISSLSQVDNCFSIFNFLYLSVMVCLIFRMQFLWYII